MWAAIHSTIALNTSSSEDTYKKQYAGSTTGSYTLAALNKSLMVNLIKIVVPLTCR